MRKYINQKILSIGLLVLAGLIVCWNPIKRAVINSYHPAISRQAIRNNEAKPGTYNYSDVKKLTMSNLATVRAGAKDIPIVGTISIPDDNLNLPIAKGITNRNLAFAAGTFRPDMKMGKGNYALAGHNMAGAAPKVLFGPLYYQAKVGQKVYLTDLKRVYEYKIYQKKFISKYDINVVKDTHKRIITLITCDATGRNRLMVRAKYQKQMPYSHASGRVKQALSEPYNNK